MNPQENFVKRVHKALRSMICTHKLLDHDFEHEVPRSQITANCAWAIRSTEQSVLYATPA
jgi:hypothetical protein